jgi:hypothetical protein
MQHMWSGITGGFTPLCWCFWCCLDFPYIQDCMQILNNN